MLPWPNQTRPSLPSPPVTHRSAGGSDKLTSAQVQHGWQLLGRGEDVPDMARTQGWKAEELGWGTSLHLPSRHATVLTRAWGVLLSETTLLLHPLPPSRISWTPQSHDIKILPFSLLPRTKLSRMPVVPAPDPPLQVPGTAYSRTPAGQGEGPKPWGGRAGTAAHTSTPGTRCLSSGDGASSSEPSAHPQALSPHGFWRKPGEVRSSGVQQPHPALPGMCSVPGEEQDSTGTAQSGGFTQQYSWGSALEQFRGEPRRGWTASVVRRPAGRTHHQQKAARAQLFKLSTCKEKRHLHPRHLLGADPFTQTPLVTSQHCGAGTGSAGKVWACALLQIPGATLASLSPGEVTYDLAARDN